MTKVVDTSEIVFTGFEWDKGNKDKNWLRHRVSTDEAEDVFYNEPLLFFRDLKHSQNEERLTAYGITDSGRKLTIVFTIRKDKIRIVSTRDQNKKERRRYEKAEINTAI